MKRISDKRLWAVLPLTVLLVLMGAGWAHSATVVEPPQSFEEMAQGIAPEAELLHLSLQDCIASAIKNNLDIEVERFVPRINDAAVGSEQGMFDPHLYFNATYTDVTVPLPSSVAVSTGGLISAFQSEQWNLTGGLTGAIPSGLMYDANMASVHTKFSTLTDLFQANGEQRLQASLTVSQPLLKNFGIDINTTGIRVAVKNKESSVYQLEQKFLETVFEVESAYWELVFAYEDLRVKLSSLQLSEDLLEENRIRLKVGVIAPLAVLQAEAGVAVREEEVITARSRVEDARDQLIRVANLFPDELVWDVEIIPVDEPFKGPANTYVEGNQIATAQANRPEIKQLLKLQEAAIMGARYAKNQLLPSLNLNASIGVVGLDEEYDSSIIPLLPAIPAPPHKGIDPAFDDFFSGDNVQWMIGFTFELPWGRHYERGQYQSANLQASQLDANIRNLRLLIIQDTRNALRSVETNWNRVLSTHETTKFRYESLRAEKKKYEVGITTAHDLLQFEEELAQARAGEQRAIIDYTLSLSNLFRATGTLLQVRNVQVDVAS